MKQEIIRTCLQWLEQGQWAEIHALLTHLPAEQTHSVTGCEFRAYVAKAMGDFAQAEQALREALQHGVKPHLTALLASNLYHQQRFDEARSLWQDLWQQNKEWHSAFHIAQTFMAESRYAQALPWLQQCLQQQPEHVPTLLQCATAHSQLQQMDCAQRHFETLLRLDPYHVEALNNYGVWCLQQQQYDKAIHCFATAMRVDEQHLPSRANLAQALLQAGRYPEAADYFQQYLALAPEDVHARYNAGVVALMLAQLGSANEHFQAVLSQTPDNIPSLLNLAAIALQRQEKSTAIAYYQRVLALETEQPIARYMLAALMQQGLPDKAPEAYVAALFDQYAKHFDHHLTQALSYQTPQHLRHVYDRVAKQPRSRWLDLGCGTGLSGAAFVDVAPEMVGVDLSEHMLAMARDKGIYRQLVHAEFSQYLTTVTGLFDVIIAADVLGYLGDLTACFQGVHSALAENGLWLFSIESAEGKAPYRLMPTGRFQHSMAYIEALVKTGHWHWLAQEAVTLRYQGHEAVKGWVIALKKA